MAAAVLVADVIDAISISQYNQANSYAIANEGLYAKYFSDLWLVGNLIIFAMAIIMLTFFDTLRKRGDALFQEISNTFQDLDGSPVSENLPDAVATEARLSLRTFAGAADLPFIGGRFGAGAYAAVNIIIVLIAVILYSRFA